MASLLINKGTITTDQIDAIWQKWFSEPLSVVGATRAEQFTASLKLADRTSGIVSSQ
jgi:hypothetical protein